MSEPRKEVELSDFQAQMLEKEMDFKDKAAIAIAPSIFNHVDPGTEFNRIAEGCYNFAEAMWQRRKEFVDAAAKAIIEATGER